ncbi:MAG: hypothetical protein ACJ8AG_31265 [Ktedonobacteraceae bacterium]
MPGYVKGDRGSFATVPFGFITSRRKTPCFSYGDASRTAAGGRRYYLDECERMCYTSPVHVYTDNSIVCGRFAVNRPRE